MQIELRHITKRFGPVLANHDISLLFPAGRIVGVLGENGAGKSTLMKILSGFQPADSGQIVLDGQPARYRSPEGAIRSGIGMLQQDPLDVAAFTVLENFVYGQTERRTHRQSRDELARLCARFGFALSPDAPVSTLSIGQRQQLEIVRLMAQGVRVLILDEPTTGISADQKMLLFDALRALAREGGVTVLLVSHKLEDVIALCDEVVVLRAGRFVGGCPMPATPDALVALMFGQTLDAARREAVSPGRPRIVFDEVTLRGRRVLVEKFSLQVCAGEVVGLAGLDESGQELILRAAAGLVRPTHGRILVDDAPLHGRGYHAFRRAGVAFSAAGRLEEGLVAGLTLTEHLALMMRGSVIDWAAARAKTAQQIALYQVRGRPDDPIERLSGGNQQRVLMALMPDAPALLALEQPTRGLDVDSAAWIWEQLLRRRAAGSAILFTSPDLDEIVTYSDRILVLFAGRVFAIPAGQAITIDLLGRLIGGHFDDAPVSQSAHAQEAVVR
jgi:simple sugar transport system ATP-binding protein